MTTKICGHDRNALRKALDFANSSNLDEASRGWPRPDDSAGTLLFDVHDPAKLAAIIAVLMRECGADIWLDGSKQAELPRRDQFALFVYFDEMIQVYLPTAEVVERSKLLVMPQARAFALALLDAPNAIAQDIERMIEEVTR